MGVFSSEKGGREKLARNVAFIGRCCYTLAGVLS